MTLQEFDKVRPYLPPNTIVEIISVPQTEPADDEVWAVETYDWGNHDGRFNVLCSACGDIFGQDFPRYDRNKFRDIYEHKPCPRCGKTFIKKGDIKK